MLDPNLTLSMFLVWYRGSAWRPPRKRKRMALEKPAMPPDRHIKEVGP